MIGATLRENMQNAFIPARLLPHRLRGGASVYVATAKKADAELVTWDVGMRKRGAAVVSTTTPAMWLETQRE